MGRSSTTYVVAKVGKSTDPNGKAYSQVQCIFKFYFKLTYFEKRKINRLSYNLRTLDSNGKQKTKKPLAPNQNAIFLKEQVILMEKIA